MGEKVQINMRIEPEFKEEIEEHVAESTEYISVTGFIRGAVNAKLKGNENPAEQPSPAVHSDISDVKDELERIRKDVTWLRNQEQDATDISELANRVRDELVVLDNISSNVEVPTDTDMSHQEYTRQVAAEGVITPRDADEAKSEGENPQTLQALADRIGATSEEVKEAIEVLREDFIPVIEVEQNGEVHYFLEK